MSLATFLTEKMIGKELCVSLGNDAETITYNQYWTSNKEFFQGIVKNVTHGVLELNIPDYGIIWINCSEIESFWKPGFKYHQAIRATVTARPIGGISK